MLDLLVGNWRCWVDDSRFWPFYVRSGTHSGLDRLVDITMDAFGHLGWTGVLVLSFASVAWNGVLVFCFCSCSMD
jgi:hypothetical protein